MRRAGQASEAIRALVSFLPPEARKQPRDLRRAAGAVGFAALGCGAIERVPDSLELPDGTQCLAHLFGRHRVFDLAGADPDLRQLRAMLALRSLLELDCSFD